MNDPTTAVVGTGITAAHDSPLRIHSAAMTKAFGAQASPTANAALHSAAKTSTRLRP